MQVIAFCSKHDILREQHVHRKHTIRQLQHPTAVHLISETYPSALATLDRYAFPLVRAL